MIVLSIRAGKKKLIACAALLVLLLAAIVCCAALRKPARAAATVPDRAAASETQRRAFLAQYGWQVTEEPVEFCEVQIPAEFNDVYTQYNALQQAQGFDLTRWKGRRVKRWTYEITNYPDAGSARVFADLLVADGRVIGGSVGTREAGGFLRGFARENVDTASAPASGLPDTGSSVSSGTVGSKADRAAESHAESVPSA